MHDVTYLTYKTRQWRGTEGGSSGGDGGERGREVGAEINKAFVWCLQLLIIYLKTSTQQTVRAIDSLVRHEVTKQ